MKAILRVLRAELAAIFRDPQILSVMMVSTPSRPDTRANSVRPNLLWSASTTVRSAPWCSVRTTR